MSAPSVKPPPPPPPTAEMVANTLMKRPARKQAEYAPEREDAPHTGSGSYNIWYNRWAGDFRHKSRGERATTRCDPLSDSGWTIGSKKSGGMNSKGTYFCFNFARGSCHLGKDCNFLHRIPNEVDEEEGARDCFGRDRHREDRYDMGGVGSFSRTNKTLYVGHVHSYGGERTEEVVRRHFSQFGEIEKVKILFSKNVAFVTFKRRSNAEFAKEAMDRQSLDAKECLNVRWATEDSNPIAQAEAKRKREEEFVEAWMVKKAKSGMPVDGNEEPYAQYPQLPAQPQAREAEDTSGTDAATSADYSSEYWAQYYAQYGYDYSYYYGYGQEGQQGTDAAGYTGEYAAYSEGGVGGTGSTGAVSATALQGISQIVKEQQEKVSKLKGEGQSSEGKNGVEKNEKADKGSTLVGYESSDGDDD